MGIILSGLFVLIPLFFIIFSLMMLMDAWRYAETSWFVFLILLTFLPLFPLIIMASAKEGKLNLADCYAILAASILPFLGATVYYTKGFKTHFISRKIWFILLGLVVLMGIIGLFSR